MEENMSDINIGVIGTGKIGMAHIQRISERLRGGKINAVWNRTRSKAEAIAEKYNCRVENKMESLIEAPDIDAIIVATDGESHKGAVLQALKEGKFIFCEKPLTPTTRGCQEIIKEEIAGGKRLIQVGFNRRFDQAYKKLKEALDMGICGKPLILHCTHRNPQVPKSYTTDMHITDTLIHEIDVLHWLLNDSYKSAQVIFPCSTTYKEEHLKDPQLAIMTTNSGIVIEVEIFVDCTFAYDINCEVVCEKGVVKLPEPANVLVRSNFMRYSPLETDWLSRFVDSYDAELQSWIDSCSGGVASGPSAWDGYIATLTAEAFVKAQKTGGIESISSDEMPEFYK
jgi:myo-inositol 2-dehydrogenase/D-chiro-inositol 1-dehydrogenase